MDPITNMGLHKPEFTKNDLLIYNAIMENPEQVTWRSTSKLAEACGVSQSALSRFVRTLGYERYQDFRSDMTSWVAQQNVPEDPGRLFYFERMERLTRAAEQVLTDDFMRDTATYVRRFDRIFATGIGKSFEPARLMTHLLRKNHIFVHATSLDTLKETAEHMGANDLLVVFSVSAQAEVMNPASCAVGKVMLLTTNVAHAYQNQVDRTVVLPFLPPDPETCPVSPVLFDVFVELLASYLSSSEG